MARILVVDDEPIIAMTVAEWLADLGHVAVGPAADLACATALAEQPVDAAILDISLGPQTTAELAERLAARGVPFAVATGHDSEAVRGAFARGVLLPKPFTFETFRHAVERLLAPPLALCV
jgi:CheY-like chemotaxis protein